MTITEPDLSGTTRAPASLLQPHDTDSEPIGYIRWLRTGATFRGHVWTRGKVTPVRASDAKMVADLLPEKEQRARFTDGAWYEVLTLEEYQAALAGPAVTEERRPLEDSGPPPTILTAAERSPADGSELTPAPIEPGHIEATELDPPAAPPAPPAPDATAQAILEQMGAADATPAPVATAAAPAAPVDPAAAAKAQEGIDALRGLGMNDQADMLLAQAQAAGMLLPQPVDLTQLTPPATAPDSDPRWPWYEAADGPTTLEYIKGMSDTEAQDFLGWEQSHKGRKGVVGPMTGN